MEGGRIASERGVVLAYWAARVERGEVTPGTAARYARIFASFERFITASGCGGLAAIEPQVCRAFVNAPRGSQPPAKSTSRLRLAVVRDAYLALRLLNIVPSDPTAGLRVVQPEQARRPIPLTPAEAARLRSAGRMSPRDHIRPATVELALGGGSHPEVAKTVVTDVNLIDGRVRLGSRSIDLEPFAITTLAARIASCRLMASRHGRPWNPDITSIALSRPLDTYPETSVAPGISSNLSRAMNRAGLTRTGLRPASVREYAANRRYALSERVEDVATFLGLESLDVARGYIDPEWQQLYGREVRAVDGRRT